jgi:exopolyphosphatase/guanosine-5'-triphosphate,3'-diphosphate pyrophosphatase
MMHASVIDIGSNSVRYMEAADESLPLYPKRLTMTRLAEGILNSGRLSPAGMERSLDAIKAYAEAAKKKLLPVYAYATSAVRDAANREEFTGLIRSLNGIETDVLSGKREAEYAYNGATGGRGALIDIGGGSLQITNGKNSYSCPAGCIRFKNAVESGVFASDFLQRIDISADVFQTAEEWTGVGGSITTLAAFFKGFERYDPMGVHGTVLSYADISELRSRLFKMGGERAHNPILSQRHDTILCGTDLLLHVMEKLGISKITVSEKDGMEGYLEYMKNSGKPTR